MIRSKQKTSSTCKALDNKKAAVKVGPAVNSAHKQMSRLWNGQDVQKQCRAKKETTMRFLKDVFQTADEIKQSQEKLKNAVDASSCQAAVLIRPYLSEAQNETLSEILEGLVASVAEHSFQIGYSSAMQTFAEAAAALEEGSHVQQ